MLRNGLLQTDPSPAPAARLSCQRRQHRRIEGIAREGTGEIGVTSAEAGVQSGGALHVLFDDQLGQLGRAQVEPSEVTARPDSMA